VLKLSLAAVKPLQATRHRIQLGRFSARPSSHSTSLMKAWIFDFDGTLVDTNEAHAQGWLLAFRDFDYDISIEAVRDLIGMGGDKLVAAAVGDEAEERDGDDLRDRSTEHFQSMAKNTRFELFPDALQLIASVRERGFKTAIATSADEEDLELILDRAGVDVTSHVDIVTTASMVERSKPSADVIQAAAQRLDVDSQTCYMVGDTAYDAEAAKRAGSQSIGVATWVHDAARLRSAGADEVYDDPAAVLAHLESILRGVNV
jgi:HAD superfamily hydrolase (TIGR01549 family)